MGLFSIKDERAVIPGVNDKETERQNRKGQKGSRTTIIKIVVTVVALVLVGILFFASSCDVTFEKDSFNVSATLCGSTTVKYSDITKVEFRDNLDKGSRSIGMGSSKISAGSFKNSEFGSYHIYAYNHSGYYIVVWFNNEVVVFNGDTEQRTRELYSILNTFMK